MRKQLDSDIYARTAENSSKWNTDHPNMQKNVTALL